MSEELHALVGAYVMDALDDEERQAFEAFMATSPATSQEVASLLEVSALLGAASAETPPAGLRRAVLSEVDATRQERPIVQSITDAPSRSTTSRTAAPSRSWATRLAYGVAAAAVTVSVGLGAAVVTLSERIDNIENSSAEVATLLAAQDSTRDEVLVGSGGRITTYISHQHGTAVTLAEGLDALDPNQRYILWGVLGDNVVPIGELVEGTPVSIQHSAGLDHLGVSIESRDGELIVPTAIEATLGA